MQFGYQTGLAAYALADLWSVCSIQPQAFRIMFPSTTINISGLKYCRDSNQQVILGYLASLCVDIKSYFLFSLVCRHFKCYPGNPDCLVTHWLVFTKTLCQKETNFTELAFETAITYRLLVQAQGTRWIPVICNKTWTSYIQDTRNQTKSQTI